MGLGRTPRRLKPKHWIAITVAVLIVAIGGFIALRYDQLEKCELQTELNTHNLQLAIEDWKLVNVYRHPPTGGGIPCTIAEYIQTGCLDGELINPFTGKAVQIIELRDPSTPGDIRLIRALETYEIDGEAPIVGNAGYRLFGHGVRLLGAPERQLDFDEDGYADPILSEVWNSPPPGCGYLSELREETLSRYGYSPDIDRILLKDNRPFWRWMFFLDP